MNLLSKLAIIFVFICACPDPAVRADSLEERAPVGLGAEKVPESRLSEVRAGSAQAPVDAPYAGVTLWDEPRLYLPPVRNMPGDSRVNAQVNLLWK